MSKFVTTCEHSFLKKVLDSGSAMAILQSRQRLLTMNITNDITCQECGKFFSDESGFKRRFRHKKYQPDGGMHTTQNQVKLMI